MRLVQFALILFAAGCGTPEAPVSLPAGAYVAGRVETLSVLLSGLRSLTGTPVAERAFAIQSRLAGCESFAGSAPPAETGELWDRLECASLEDQPAAARKRLAEADVVFALPVGPASTAERADAPTRLIGTLLAEPDGSLRVTAHFEFLSEGLAALLLPAREGAGPAVLNPSGTLVHLRLRPAAGLDVASLVPKGSQADGLFKLKSRIFSSAILDGSVELAIYEPDSTRRMPPVVLAAGTSFEAPAVAAMEAFLHELEQTWGLRHVPAEIGGHSGACLVGVQLFSEFEPCYVTARGTLLVGWNRSSVVRALGRGEGLAPSAQGGLVAHLDRFAEADAALHEAWAPERPPPAIRYPWRNLQVELGRDGDRVQVEVLLAAAGAR